MAKAARTWTDYEVAKLLNAQAFLRSEAAEKDATRTALGGALESARLEFVNYSYPPRQPNVRAERRRTFKAVIRELERDWQRRGPLGWRRPEQEDASPARGPLRLVIGNRRPETPRERLEAGK